VAHFAVATRLYESRRSKFCSVDAFVHCCVRPWVSAARHRLPHTPLPLEWIAIDLDFTLADKGIEPNNSEQSKLNF